MQFLKRIWTRYCEFCDLKWLEDFQAKYPRLSNVVLGVVAALIFVLSMYLTEVGHGKSSPWKSVFVGLVMVPIVGGGIALVILAGMWMAYRWRERKQYRPSRRYSKKAKRKCH